MTGPRELRPTRPSCLSRKYQAVPDLECTLSAVRACDVSELPRGRPDDRFALDERSFVQMKVWRTRHPVEGCTHGLKYRLAYVVDGECVLRYDNEAGKGDHRHVHGSEMPYAFESLEDLQVDFWKAVDALWEARK